jgi:hypothetical protein
VALRRIKRQNQVKTQFEDWRGMIVVCASQRKAKFTLFLSLLPFAVFPDRLQQFCAELLRTISFSTGLPGEEPSLRSASSPPLGLAGQSLLAPAE